MNIGLYDVDGHAFPNLPLMKISAYHKQRGDSVELMDDPMKHYDKLYVSKVFGDEYSKMQYDTFNADEVVYGGTGFDIDIVDGKEVYAKDRTPPMLPDEIEHIYPDYDLYPELTKGWAFGFLSRGCPNNCDFCIVSKKEGTRSHKVADLSEFWNGQKNINLLDPNILACTVERRDLLSQLADSKAKVLFNQGLDARFITEDVSEQLSHIKVNMVHFAWDYMKNEDRIINGLKNYAKYNSHVRSRDRVVYVLTNFDTTLEEDVYRVRKIEELGFLPDIRIYRKPTAPRAIRDLARWCNNRFIHWKVDLMDYAPRKDGKTFKELYFNNERG